MSCGVYKVLLGEKSAVENDRKVDYHQHRGDDNVFEEDTYDGLKLDKSFFLSLLSISVETYNNDTERFHSTKFTKFSVFLGVRPHESV